MSNFSILVLSFGPEGLGLGSRGVFDKVPTTHVFGSKQEDFNVSLCAASSSCVCVWVVGLCTRACLLVPTLHK